MKRSYIEIINLDNKICNRNIEMIIDYMHGNINDNKRKFNICLNYIKTINNEIENKLNAIGICNYNKKYIHILNK